MWLDKIERENYRDASLLATLYNTNAFRFNGDGILWEAEDFLGRGDRQAKKLEQLKAKLEMYKISTGELKSDWAQEIEENNRKWGRH